MGFAFGMWGASALFPGECPSCGADGDNNICPDCLEHLPVALVAIPGLPQFVSSSQSMAPYVGPVGDLLRRAKYRPDERVCGQLASLLCSRIDRVKCDLDVVVGVPQNSWATLKRGFSPVDCLAKAVGERLNIPVIRAAKRRRGVAIAGVDKVMRGSVASSQYWPIDGQEIGGRVLLVDDVVTTGSTASAVARVLLQQGAESVHLITLASPALA
jgi:predicted amidophosphoribosyltransferase